MRAQNKHMSHDDEDDDDIKAFRQAMRHVQKLSEPTTVPHSRTPTPVKPIHHKPVSRPEAGLSFHEYLAPVRAETYLLYHIPSLAARDIKKLQKGLFDKQAYLDLHGLNRQEAHDALLDFITACQQQDLRYAVIIHGKSLHNPQKPVIKNCLNHWLRDLPAILAFCSAKPQDGGTGALYVRLRKQQLYPT